MNPENKITDTDEKLQDICLYLCRYTVRRKAARIDTVNLVRMIAFVPKDVAIKMNLLLYRIRNEQIDM